MNKWLVIVLVAAIGALVYVKLSEPKISSRTAASLGQVQPVEIQQQALPEAAKDMVSEINSNNSEINVYVPPDVIESQKRIEEARQAAQNKIDEERRQAELYAPKDVDDIPETVGLGAPLKWPCKSATFAQIVDAYGKVWGGASPVPHDSAWYTKIAEDMVDYTVCRAFTSNNPAICGRLSFFQRYDKVEDHFRSRVKDILGTCSTHISVFYLNLFSLGKIGGNLCYGSLPRFLDESFCDMSQKYRGQAFCEKTKIDKESMPFCLAALPASLGDCASLPSEEKKVCNGIWLMYLAIKNSNIKLCPTGRFGIMCRAYFTKGVQDICGHYMDKLSKDFCSGGKYSIVRKVKLK